MIQGHRRIRVAPVYSACAAVPVDTYLCGHTWARILLRRVGEPCLREQRDGTLGCLVPSTVSAGIIPLAFVPEEAVIPRVTGCFFA